MGKEFKYGTMPPESDGKAGPIEGLLGWFLSRDSKERVRKLVPWIFNREVLKPRPAKRLNLLINVAVKPDRIILDPDGSIKRSPRKLGESVSGVFWNPETRIKILQTNIEKAEADLTKVNASLARTRQLLQANSKEEEVWVGYEELKKRRNNLEEHIKEHRKIIEQIQNKKPDGYPKKAIYDWTVENLTPIERRRAVEKYFERVRVEKLVNIWRAYKPESINMVTTKKAVERLSGETSLPAFMGFIAGLYYGNEENNQRVNSDYFAFIDYLILEYPEIAGSYKKFEPPQRRQFK